MKEGVNKRTAANSMLCWNRGTDEVAIFPHPDIHNLSVDYGCSTLGCWSYVKDMSSVERTALVFVEAMHLIVRDKCDPMAVHRALLEVEEYRAACANDMPEFGAFMKMIEAGVATDHQS